MKDRIIELLCEICEDDIVKHDLEVDLFEEGLLDSLGFAELIYSIEEKFGVIISPSEIEQKDVNTPNKIIRMIMERAERE